MLPWVFLTVLPLLVQAEQQLLCVSLISDSVLVGDDQFSTPSWCTSQCETKGSDFKYVALKNGGECYCLKSLPLGLGGNCNVKCKGYGLLMCGGSSDYLIFAMPGVDTSNLSSQGLLDLTTQSTSSSETSSSTKTTASTTDDSKSSPSTTDDSSQTTPPPLTYTVVTSAKTSGGTIITVTETLDLSQPTSLLSLLASASSSSSDSDKKGKSTNVGAIVGGVVGGVGGAFLLALLAFLFMRWKRNQEEEDDEFETEKYFDNSGLGRGVSSKGLKRLKQSPLDMPMTNPFDHPLDANAPSGGVRPPPLGDPRLNPVMLGRRRLSEGLLVDDADYSRKILHVANPE